MSNNRKNKEYDDKKKKSVEEILVNEDNGSIEINITVHNTYNIGRKEFHLEQRAEGGGQINKNVGTNANQGGQNAIDHSETANKHSQFADGNGRSGIAGNDNDEAGGQQGIKVRDSAVIKSRIESASEHSETPIDEISVEEENTDPSPNSNL